MYGSCGCLLWYYHHYTLFTLGHFIGNNKPLTGLYLGLCIICLRRGEGKERVTSEIQDHPALGHTIANAFFDKAYFGGENSCSSGQLIWPSKAGATMVGGRSF